MEYAPADEFLTKREVATRRLRDAIRLGRYAPGDPLKQNDIAADLGLSSTPVREALTELRACGLVVYESHRGARVATIDVARVRELYTARKIVERETARLAFENIGKAELAHIRGKYDALARWDGGEDYEALVRRDEDFHLSLYEASRNAYLIRSIRDLWHSFPRYFMWNIEGRLAQSKTEHRRIMSALRKRDRTRFLESVEAHIDCSLSAIVAHIEANAALGP